MSEGFNAERLSSIAQASRKRKRKEQEEKDVAAFFDKFESIILKIAEDGERRVRLDHCPPNYVALGKELTKRDSKFISVNTMNLPILSLSGKNNKVHNVYFL